VRGGIWLVLHLDAKKRGSMEQQLLALALRLRAQGVPLTYAFGRPPAPFPGDELRALGVDVRALDFAHPVRAAEQLALWLSSKPAALVHFHFVRAYSPLVAVAKLAGAKVAVHEHVTLIPGPRERSLREAGKALRGRAMNWMADRRLAVSRFVAESVVTADRVPPARVEVVENGVDLARFTGEGGAEVRSELALGEAPLIACIARFSNEKGVETAIRAVPLLSRQAQLALVGEGEEEARFRALAAGLGVASRVRFLGLRHDVERILAAARVVVVPSHWDEAFGLSVVEGMASSRPVIVSRSGAMPDILGDAGLVVPKRDPAALAAAVDRVLDDEHLAATLSRAGRRRAEERYSMEHYVNRMVAAYERLCPGLAGYAKAAA
jgi:glycosyltransferase involved in cell wall biosynthesis